MIHIEGMGLLGVQLAAELEELGYAYTWNDTDRAHTAWHCCTGMVYPSGSDRDMTGLRWWQRAIDDGHPLAEWAARSEYVFAHKKPPHGGRYDFGPFIGSRPLQRALGEGAVAVNVPQMVTDWRERIASKRRDRRPDGNRLLVRAHSTEERREGYLWGWAARVRFDDGEGPQRTYYAKKHRFNLTYAYPIPGTGQWWAGSVLKHQKTPLEVSSKRLMEYVTEWKGNAAELLGIGPVTVDSIEQGWRPRRAADAPNEAREESPGVWSLAPEPTSGLRHGPLIVQDLMERIGL